MSMGQAGEMRLGHLFREAAGYLAGALVTVLLLVPMLRLDLVDLSLPLAWGGDAFYYQVLAKGIVENGLTLSNPSLGAPHGMSLADAPVAVNALHVGVLRVLAAFTSDPVRIINLYFLAAFPLVALSALAVLRHLGISWTAALVVAILFAFAPYRLARGESHLFLGACYLVPLGALVALWACQGLAGRRARMAVGAAVCVALALGGPYYAFFTVFFLVVGGLGAAVRHRHPRLLLEPLVLAAVIGGVGLLQALPTREWFRQNGVAPVMRREAAEAEFYGLRVAQMLLPVRGHLVGPLAALRERYELRMPPPETGAASLGMVAGAGFVLLLALAAFSVLQGRPAGADTLGDLGFLNLAGLLLATTGGFGSLVALTVLPQIRCYTRMSIFLAFFSLIAVAVLLDHLSARWPRAALALCGLFLVAGLLDQGGMGPAGGYGTISAEHAHDRAFVRQIEARLPTGSAVFQLPVVAFVEGEASHGCLGYDPARGYLHSRGLRWSYGVARGREGDLWQRRVASLAAGEMVDTLCFSGFAGLWVDRRGFAEDGAVIVADLSSALGTPPLASGSGRFVFFDLLARAQALRQRLSRQEWAMREDASLHPVLAAWEEGFYGLEGSGAGAWRWCSGEGRLGVLHRSPRIRRATMRMRLVAPGKERVTIEGLGSREEVVADEKGGTCEITMEVPPGRHWLTFSCPASPVAAPGDSRRLVFRVHDFTLESDPTEHGRLPFPGEAR